VQRVLAGSAETAIGADRLGVRTQQGEGLQAPQPDRAGLQEPVPRGDRAEAGGRKLAPPKEVLASFFNSEGFGRSSSRTRTGLQRTGRTSPRRSFKSSTRKASPMFSPLFLGSSSSGYSSATRKTSARG